MPLAFKEAAGLYKKPLVESFIVAVEQALLPFALDTPQNRSWAQACFDCFTLNSSDPVNCPGKAIILEKFIFLWQRAKGY